MKVVTMYLPQFHRVAENDAWWGEGFTEWVAVRNARPLYDGHEQPKAPLNDNYYDLLDQETMKWQAELMHQYGVYGQCFYHYYFKDGRKILEKPAENLLKWKNIDMPFCLSWANESWARSWSNLTEKNVWSPRGEDEEERIKNPSGILLEQKYGGEAEWKAHYEYLCPFFQDSRYIRVEGKPVFLIYQPSLIPCIQQILRYWGSMAEKDGLNGIYFISMNSFEISGFQAYLYHEPQFTMRNVNHQESINADKNVRMYAEYKDIWNKIIRRPSEAKKKLMQGGFTGYDDTPRRGRGGRIIGQVNPQIFQKMLSQLLKKNADMGNEITFLNAWNEWGEGMYLEPDAKDGYAYLEAVKYALEHYQDEKSEFLLNTSQRAVAESAKLTERYRCYWIVLHQWMLLRENSVSIGEYLYQKGIHKVAIYGMGMLGLHLVKELENSPVEIHCGIDRAAEELHQTFPLVTPGEPIGEVDAIIVTPVYAFDEIYTTLQTKYHSKILSLMELINDAE